MAVQAHYQTNIFHNQSLQDEIRNNYSSQPQVAKEEEGIDSRFFDQQSPKDISFNTYFSVGSCGLNPRKREKEVNMNQFIDISQLHTTNTGVNTGLRLSFSDQQLRQHSVSTQIKEQGDEIDHFLQIQGEEIRRTLVEKCQNHYRALVEAAETAASRRLKEKEAELVKASWRKAELEAKMAQVSMEAAMWREKMVAGEAETEALQAKLEHAIVSGGGRSMLGDRGESGLMCASRDDMDAESGYVDPERVVVVSGPGCKSCGNRVASVLLLPCRHLCVCSECDGVVLACPLCLCVRSSSLEVYMS
uniref:BOI-related E3 ubiquitin-protein ligase 1-like isoform X2 n=1 Tax=Erigeron canadensis TaxID=72917 RepID=UPI001CB99866|nr:BOI-related E3 ubiquitin-protein ligase 1-like isoform X2 [Erigeron canadensis]